MAHMSPGPLPPFGELPISDLGSDFNRVRPHTKELCPVGPTCSETVLQSNFHHGACLDVPCRLSGNCT